MENRFRRRQLERVVETSGETALDALATFRRRPLFSYGLNVLLSIGAIANLATDQLWVRIALLVLIGVNLIAPSGSVTVAAGPERAVVSTASSWRHPTGTSFRPLPFAQVQRRGRIRWSVADQTVWAWGDDRRLLARIAALAG